MSKETKTTAPQSKEEMEALIRGTINQIGEALKKSGYTMAKDDEEQPDALGEQAEGGEGAPAPEAEGGEGAPALEGAPAEGGEGALAPEDQEGAPAGGEGQDDMDAMAQHLSEMPEEELHMLLQLVQGEMMNRQQSAEGGEGQEGAPAPEGAPAAGGELQMSMKKEFASMAKSMQDIANAVKQVADQGAQTAKEVAALKKSQGSKQSVATKPAASNRSVQVLNKSGAENQPKAKEELKKSDVESFLMNEMRKSSRDRHPAITTQTIAELTYIKTPEQLKDFAEGLRKQGVQVPA